MFAAPAPTSFFFPVMCIVQYLTYIPSTRLVVRRCLHVIRTYRICYLSRSRLAKNPAAGDSTVVSLIDLSTNKGLQRTGMRWGLIISTQCQWTAYCLGSTVPIYWTLNRIGVALRGSKRTSFRSSHCSLSAIQWPACFACLPAKL